MKQATGRAKWIQAIPWTLVILVAAWLAAPPLAAQEQEQECGPSLSKKERKEVTVVDAQGLEPEAAIQQAEEQTGKKIEVLFDALELLSDPKIEREVMKKAAERGCRVAIFTQVEKQQIGQRPVRFGGVGGATIAEAIFRYDTTVHYGRFVSP